VVAITTETGTLRGPDLFVTITLTDAVEQRREASGA
jgi:small nuclear ribonucleoprotein (snRNP)-like protein